MNGFRTISKSLKALSRHANLVERHRTRNLNQVRNSKRQKNVAWEAQCLASPSHLYQNLSLPEQIEGEDEKVVIGLELDPNTVPQFTETASATVLKTTTTGSTIGSKRKLFSLLRFCTYVVCIITVSKIIRFRLFTFLANSRSTAVQTHTKTGISVPKWTMVGKSISGTKHSKTTKSCQDACKYQHLPSGELVIVVADGAGSAPFSEQGATQATNAAVNYLRKAIPQYKPNTSEEWKSIISHAFELARARLISHAATQAELLKNYATTLQIIVTSDDLTVSAIIGDGTAVGLRADNSLVRMMSPQQGEYANATNFITSNSAMSKIDIQVFQQPFVGIAVLTDGLLALAIDEHNTPYSRFFIPLFKFLDASTNNKQANKGLKRFLSSERINNRTDDDKTLVLALRKSAQRCREVTE